MNGRKRDLVLTSRSSRSEKFEAKGVPPVGSSNNNGSVANSTAAAGAVDKQGVCGFGFLLSPHHCDSLRALFLDRSLWTVRCGPFINSVTPL